MTEYWAAVDSDGWRWLSVGEPKTLSKDGIWDQEESNEVLSHRRITELACRDVSPSCKRKLGSLDFVNETVEYEGEEVHG